MLTQLQIIAAKPNAKPYSLSDGQGLFPQDGIVHLAVLALFDVLRQAAD